MDLERYKIKLEKRGKKFKGLFTARGFFNVDLSNYTGKDYEILEHLAMNHAGPSKILYLISILAEREDDFTSQGLQPYSESDLYALIQRTAKRMKNYPSSPFYEVVGLSKSVYIDILKRIEKQGVKHPVNAVKWYTSSFKFANNWQEALATTYGFFQGYYLILQKLETHQSMKKALAFGRLTGVIKI